MGYTEQHPNIRAGWDYRVTDATAPDDVLKFGRTSEAYPRLWIDPATGRIYAGTGTAPPTPVGETYSNAVLVATADSPESWKAQATYVADGTADEDAWNTAAFVAAASGRNLLVGPGTINVRSTALGIFDNIDYQGSGWRGSQATTITCEDGYTPAKLVHVDGVDANDRITSWRFHGFHLDSDSINGSTKATDLMVVEWASDALMWDIAWGNTSGHALKMLGFWDSEVHSFRVDGAGSRGAANEAAVKAAFYMWSDDSTLANCNNVRFHHFIVENTPTNQSDAFFYADSGAGSDDNHNSCSLTDFKMEHRSVINQASNIVPSILLDGSHNFDVTNFHLFIGTYRTTGSYTPQPVILMRNNLGTNIGPFSAQGVDTGVGTASIRSYIKTEGTNTGCLIDKGRVSANTGNVPSVSAVEIGGTWNSQVGSLQWWYDSTGGTAELITGWPVTYTPTVRNSAGTAMDNTGGVNYGTVERYGVNRCRVEVGIEFKPTFSDTGASTMTIDLPLPAKARAKTAGMTSSYLGHGLLNEDNSFAINKHRHVTVATSTGSNSRAVLVLDGGVSGSDYWGEGNPYVVSQDCQVWLWLDYEYDT